MTYFYCFDLIGRKLNCLVALGIVAAPPAYGTHLNTIWPYKRFRYTFFDFFFCVLLHFLSLVLCVWLYIDFWCLDIIWHHIAKTVKCSFSSLFSGQTKSQFEMGYSFSASFNINYVENEIYAKHKMKENAILTNFRSIFRMENSIKRYTYNSSIFSKQHRKLSHIYIEWEMEFYILIFNPISETLSFNEPHTPASLYTSSNITVTTTMSSSIMTTTDSEQPYFDFELQRNVTVTVGQTGFLHCRVERLGDKDVSKWLKCFVPIVCYFSQCII